VSGLPVLLPALVGLAAAWAANLFGFWWVTFLVGVGLGLVVRRGPAALGWGALVGALAWGLPLAWMSRIAPVGRTAQVVSGILGVRGSSAPAIALTVLIGVLLGLTGAWLAAAGRGMWTLGRRPA
jgi:hypothetical protein